MNVSTNYLLTSIRYALIVCYILISLVPAVAQMRLDQNKKLSQYVLRGWNTEDGLATEAINELIQTPDGYIWIATYSGLHRFDGKEFTVYNGKNSAIPSSNVATLQTDHENTLWIGGLHGIAKYVSGEFIVPKPLEETKNYSIEEMLITKSKEIWFSTKSNSLFRFNGNKLEDFTEEFEVANSTILTIREDLKGSIYFGTDDSQLIIYSDGKVDKHQLDIEVNGVNALYAYQDLVYLGTGRGLYIWDGKDLSKSSVLSNTTINEIIIDSNRNFWMGTLKGLFKFNEKSNTLDSLTEQNGMPNNIVRDHIFDQEGNLWVGTYRSGIFFLSDGSITSFTENDGLATDIITSTTEIEPGTFLLGNENGVLNLLRNDSITPYTPPIKIPSERLKNLVTDSKGRVWISTYGGLIILDGEKSKHHSVANGFPDNFIRVAYEDQQGTMWIGTKNAGLFAFTSKDDWKQITIHDGLSSNYIMSIEEDLKGNLLVSTMSGLNFVKDGKIIKSITVDDGLPSNFMFSTYPDNEFIWIASNDGLTGYSDDRIVNFTTENGLPSNSIYDVLPDKEGNFWIPSENSIIFIDKDDLSSALRDPDLKIKAKQFDKSYSMKNSHCLGAVHSFSDSEGQFWIPTLGGIVKLDPQEVQSPELKPKTIIENIYADNNPLDF
ncbi:MAG: hypothetical protein HRT61_12645, partial [Ekhidna sp.]|nr:hypothetical protein [Ekhidna sp.]